MARIALKVDVDTWRGTRLGVPALVDLFRAEGADATFLFSLGPDHTGRAVLRALRPGFLKKVARTSVLEHYGLRTLLYGMLLPGPDIGLREAPLLRSVRDAGFEVGVHCWDHVRWQDHLLREDDAWAAREMARAVKRFTEIFGCPPRVHGAAGWQFHDGAARAEAAQEIRSASDVRGTHPFVPVNAAGETLGPTQFPTTLPTLDELIGLDGADAGNVHTRLLERTAGQSQDQVFTLHAELEGQRLMPVLSRLMAGWVRQGHTLVALRTLEWAAHGMTLPRHTIVQQEVPGRSGRLAVQGPCIG
ncbi:polysaccharide deacetylase family protein [Xylophilus rhododendri]|uniref:Polysaccharide deacetylase family protein n=1 Tax=Xylophilus rhododendri TaxID=2697032 RepID=A0A857J8N5_9BURK|nr:polysaccharide deacetylase family protein [Xylophilus rhododendri]QHJ00335.1 polysaccharide deacetylase family protein [Xylophilus rhododendri]